MRPTSFVLVMMVLGFEVYGMGMREEKDDGIDRRTYIADRTQQHRFILTSVDEVDTAPLAP